MNSTKKRCHLLDAGMKGFLLTCNNAEKRAVQEAYNVLNEYADLLYGPEEMKKSEEAVDESDDFESEIRKEIQDVKTRKVAGQRRFQVVETKTTNCVFIRTTIADPDVLLSKLINDIYDTGVSKCRFILRMFPVLGTCHAHVDKIEKLATEVLAPFLGGSAADEPLTYCTVYKVRCNNLSRDEILPMIGRVALQLRPNIKVNFEQPDVVVSVDVLQKVCCISVLKDFFKLRKYNLQEICKERSVASEPGQNCSAATGTIDNEGSSKNCSEALNEEGTVGSDNALDLSAAVTENSKALNLITYETENSEALDLSKPEKEDSEASCSLKSQSADSKALDLTKSDTEDSNALDLTTSAVEDTKITVQESVDVSESIVDYSQPELLLNQ